MTILDLVAGDLGTAWIGVADAIIKATLLFLAAGAASFLLRRRSAALRHMIWTLALAARSRSRSWLGRMICRPPPSPVQTSIISYRSPTFSKTSFMAVSPRASSPFVRTIAPL